MPYWCSLEKDLSFSKFDLESILLVYNFTYW